MGVSITPDEVEQTMKRESLLLQWRGDSVGQNRDGRFLMLVGRKDKGKGETIEYLAKYVDINIVSLV